MGISINIFYAKQLAVYCFNSILVLGDKSWVR